MFEFLKKSRRRRERAARAAAVFDELRGDIDERFEEAVWTGRVGGRGEHPPPYELSDRARRQLCWLSYVSAQLRTLPPSGKLLDVGSNIFWNIGLAASPWDVTVVDVRAHPVAEKFPFRFVESSVAKLPFQDGEFDVATFPQLLHHIGLTFGQVVDAKAHRHGFGELSRVVKSGGHAVLATCVKRGRTAVGPDRPRVYGVDHLRHLFDEGGFDTVDERFASHQTMEPLIEAQLPEAVEGYPADWALCTLRKR